MRRYEGLGGHERCSEGLNFKAFVWRVLHVKASYLLDV